MIHYLSRHVAEQPRKDSGKVFFSEDFLHGCNKKYGVIIPRDQENQAQPFVSKHFNVVDPLRANNNLGRSVSKGMIYASYLELYEPVYTDATVTDNA